MKIKITRDTVAQGEIHTVGSVLDVSEKEGRLLIGIGKAEEIKAPEKPAKIKTADKVAPNAETADAKPEAKKK